jgi:5-methylcytosine-specific restriction endonuclease McrA
MICRFMTASRSLDLHARLGVFRRDDYICRHCGREGTTFDLEADHITPRSWGGGDESDNLQTLCRRCNRSKRDLFVG